MKTILPILVTLLALALRPAIATVRHVNLANPNPAPPYTTWATAATTIQEAIDSASPGDEILVTNGTYYGGVEVPGELVLRSVNGPAVTVIDGDYWLSCVSLSEGSTLAGFTLMHGSAEDGAGVSCAGNQAVVSNCILRENEALRWGGGAHLGTLSNCRFTSNVAPYGAGAFGSILNNCTVTGNSADVGGGVFGSTLTNCIAYNNHAPLGANHFSSLINYSCTTPLPDSGVGNFSEEPQLMTSDQLGESSPCRGRGAAAPVTGVDIDGEPWGFPPSIGSDEFHPITGPLALALRTDCQAVAANYAVNLRLELGGQATAVRWDFGDGTIVSNQFNVTHLWASSGEKTVVVTAFNASHPEGVTERLTVIVEANPVIYVSLDSANPVPPYTSWSKAARTIQAAADVFCGPVTIIVSNGVYGPVVVKKSVAIQSLHGPEVTSIDGGGVARCISLDRSGASISGFTLTNGFSNLGGGVSCVSTGAIVSNCIITGNSATLGGGVYHGMVTECTLSHNSAATGGAAYLSTLDRCNIVDNTAASGGGVAGCALTRCTIARNSAVYSGGGASAAFFFNISLPSILSHCQLTGNYAPRGGGVYDCIASDCLLFGNDAGDYGGAASDSTFSRCTIVGNSAGVDGGGVFFSKVTNCIVYYNAARNDSTDPGANHSASGLGFSCTAPLPTSGEGNISQLPEFLDIVGGNWRLGSNSPCINAGRGAPTEAGVDLSNQPRIVNGTVDMGAYEFQSPTSLISHAWLQDHGLPIDGSADSLDLDGDQLTNYQEWRAGTNPTNAASVLRLLTSELHGPYHLLRWSSVRGRSYFLERSTNLTSGIGFIPLARNIKDEAGASGYIDLLNDVTAGASYFYRVGVE